MIGVEKDNQEKALGQAIANARKNAGYTQQSLCGVANLSYSTLAKIERGAIKSPSVFTVGAIANATNTTVEDLIGITDQKIDNKVYKTARNGVKFVYFDINGVLVRFFQRAFTNIALDYGVPADKVEEIFWRYNDAVCRGEMGIDKFDGILADRLGVKNISWAKYYINNIELIKEMRESIIWVAQNYKVGLLSNIMPGLIDGLIAKGLLPDINYQTIIDSSRVGAIKPEEKIYKVATDLAKVLPQEILFIDDSRVNVMAADKFGWKVLWFDDFHPSETKQLIEKTLEYEG